MKLRSTTPASRSRLAKGIVLSGIAFIFAVTTMPVTQPAFADQYDDKIAVLTADMARYQAEADRLNSQSTTLQNAVAQLNNEKNALQSQINLNQTQSDKLVIEIADTEKEIKNNQDALGKTIADLYIDGDTSPIELLASSTNIGDFLNKQEYRTSVKNELNTTIIKVQDLKTQLDTKKVDLDKVLASQTSARDNLAVKESQQRSLLAQTQNDEDNYQNLIKSNVSQIASAKAAQAAIRARANATGGYTLVDAGSLSGYPWNSSNCVMQGYMSTGGAAGTDGEDGYGYGCRQCVSFVAWRIAKATGVYYNDLGNGGSAGYNLINKHGYTNLGQSPQAGSVAVLWGTSYAPYASNSSPGHVAYVEGVSPDGSHVTVSQYNYNYGAGWGMYSEMVLSTSFFDQYVKP
jgi:peptidoglycan hydrolase CwlO-like protein